jgi:hypothetical protein
MDLADYVRWRDILPDLSGLPTEEAWEAFQGAHLGRCAICRQLPTASAKRAAKLVIDHCHVTGWVRGLLCRSCNQRAGSGWRHERLALSETPVVDLYVQFPPAAISGLYRMYEPAFWGDPHDQLSRAIWHVGAAGTESGADIQDRDLVAHMRQWNRFSLD